jgi:hypothetical protein
MSKPAQASLCPVAWTIPQAPQAPTPYVYRPIAPLTAREQSEILEKIAIEHSALVLRYHDQMFRKKRIVDIIEVRKKTRRDLIQDFEKRLAEVENCLKYWLDEQDDANAEINEPNRNRYCMQQVKERVLRGERP